MARKYFGTDGIRGLANGDKLTPELALRIGMAAGTKFVRGDHRKGQRGRRDPERPCARKGEMTQSRAGWRTRLR